MRIPLPVLLPVLSVALLAGCGDGRPELAKVHGRVMVAGKPVPLGTIIFWPESGRSAQGQIQPDGTYTLTTFDAEDGALLGPHVVTIEAVDIQDTAPVPKSLDDEFKVYRKPTDGTPVPHSRLVIRAMVPERYARRETTDLKAEVKRGDNAIDFDLKAK